jgi:hypothetical protein
MLFFGVAGLEARVVYTTHKLLALGFVFFCERLLLHCGPPLKGSEIRKCTSNSKNNRDAELKRS